MSPGARGDAFLQDARALVHHRQQQAVEDLRLSIARRATPSARARAPRSSRRPPGPARRRGRPRGRGSSPCPSSGRAAPPPPAHRPPAPACRSRWRMRQPMSSPARSPIAQGPMRKPKSVSALSTCSGSAPSSSRRSTCCGAAGEHPVADEAEAHADHDRHLAEPAADLGRRRQRVGRGVLRAHHLEQLHHVGRREEVHPQHVARRARSPPPSRRCRGRRCWTR